MIIDFILAAHIIGLMMGAGGGFGSMLTQTEAGKRPPEQANVLKTLGPVMANFSAFGLVLMWITGLALVFVKYGSLAALPQLFWLKMIFVATLTVSAITLQATYTRIKAGDVAAAARLPILGRVAGMSSLIAVVFAVLAFH